uniref:Obg-like ATPase 1 n=1 Tax=Prasinoderma coloniale TaxID=156133 RepID=A0A7R9Y5W4_9VIRI|eukprot:PRCOL_00005588-RA
MPPKKKEEETPELGAGRFGRVRNNLRMGLVGLPNVGKSSLFNLFTEQSAAAENFPFCTIDPNEARCPVPDERFDHLCEMFKPPSKIPAYLHVTDIAGLVKGAAEGAGLGNAFLSHIQAIDGIFHVVRAFDNDEVLHVDDSVDPIRDLETIQHELCAKDLDALERAVAAENDAVRRNPKMKLSPVFTETMDKCKELLEANKPIRAAEWSNSAVAMIKDKLHMLITTKPCIYLVNLSEKDYLRKKNKWLAKIHAWIKEKGDSAMIPISVEFEEKVWDLKQSNDAAGLKDLEDAGAKSSIPKAVTLGYKELNLIYFFTAGEKEVRAWTVYNGACAPQAAGVIHTDFERGFIKAETVAYEDFKKHSTAASMAEVKAAGKYRQEGKSYVVKDGDIFNFKFNVTTAKK